MATQHGFSRSLLLIWVEKYRKRELTLDVQREVQIPEYEQKIAALERKVGQLTMELDLVKKGLSSQPLPTGELSSIISGPGASPSREGAA